MMWCIIKVFRRLPAGCGRDRNGEFMQLGIKAQNPNSQVEQPENEGFAQHLLFLYTDDAEHTQTGDI